MNKSLEKKIELQKEAESAHIATGLKSTVAMSVGTGKSVIAINRMKKVFKKKTTKGIFFGDRTIYLTNFKLELEKFKCSSFIDKLDLCCIDSLHKYEDIKYDIIVFDEAHLSPEAGYNFILQAIEVNPKVEVLCLTGTPKNTDGFKKLLSICPISYEKKIDNSIEEGIINDYEINVIKIALSDKKDIHIKTKEYDFWTSERASYESLYKKLKKANYSKGFPFEMTQLKSFLKNTKTKLEFTKALIKTLKYKKILVYAGSIAQADLFPYKAYHSKLGAKEAEANYNAFYNGDIIELVNVNGIKEAVSVPELTHAIIMNVEASDSSMTQQLGRLTRLIPKNEKGILYVLLFEDSIEEEWFTKASQKLDQNKIKWL